jgi:NADPH2:quinone reductase
MGRRSTIGGSTLRSRTVEEKSGVAGAVEERVVSLLGRGTVVVPVAERFPLAHATEAYERFAKGDKLGKIVLVN